MKVFLYTDLSIVSELYVESIIFAITEAKIFVLRLGRHGYKSTGKLLTDL